MRSWRRKEENPSYNVVLVRIFKYFWNNGIFLETVLLSGYPLKILHDMYPEYAMWKILGGAAMGNSLSPLQANFLMSKFVTKIKKEQ